MKKEQGARIDGKGAVKIGKRERGLKNGREQGERGKRSKGAGSIDPPNRASQTGECRQTYKQTDQCYHIYYLPCSLKLGGRKKLLAWFI